ncbi:PA2778 family cysteine peptidase [Pseudomonas sp.]|uniref:PA2778 family cysteine peptidase n=1 Tax=Pseudomonas sp. TaxID=306 RepID=UPI00257EA60A|nr:PA2778 family cysteine peptidase [Pseudomonas sp.]
MYQSLMLLRALAVLSVVVLAGCASSPTLSPATQKLPERVELTAVPFFAQNAYQCGPAALATMLNQRGQITSPGLLKDKVYIPGREGSLQVEMVAAARSHDLLVYPLKPQLDTLLTEVAAGNPVLVLQNLGFDWYPQWHFAVVVGFDLREKHIILRSGTTRRLITDFAGFDQSWAKAGRWAVVTMPVNKVPATAEAHAWIKAANELEQTDRAQSAATAYRTATQQWPDEPLAWFALANSRYAAGDKNGAETALRTSIKHDPAFAEGWFNLSQVLAEQNCAPAAEQAAACARRLAPADKRFMAKPATSVSAKPAQCAALPACPAH